MNFMVERSQYKEILDVQKGKNFMKKRFKGEKIK
jgi:hypothetical protein